MLINLAGKSVDCRYHKRNMEAIRRSRTETTRQLGELIGNCKRPPALWVNASTATIYRHAEDRPMTEAEGEIGTGFSVSVARDWEKTLFDFELPETRQIALRMAISLGKNGGVLKPVANLVRVGLGGRQGNGKQMISWVHVEDIYRVILFLQSDSALEGVINCSSPNPVDNASFMAAIRKSLGIPFGLPTPGWLLEIGAVLIRTETELILKSRWVLPDRLLKAGFTFKYPVLSGALEKIFHDA